MQLFFYGAARVVTGSNYLLKVGQKQIIVDCGIFQGPPELNELNYLPWPYDPKAVDYVFITHSHLDHCGRLCKLVKDGFKGQILCTPPTKDLMAVALEDAVHLMKEEAKDKNLEPLYGETDLQDTLKLIQTYEYDAKNKLDDNLEFRFQDAGHILGSSIIELWLTENNRTVKTVFSGDLGNPPTPLLKPTAKITEADYLIIESTYGDRLHEDRQERNKKLQETISRVMKRGGILLIPSFAIERTQELLYELNNMVENQLIPKAPVFIDSPLAIKITRVYQKYEKYFNKKTRYVIASGDDIFSFPGLRFTETKEESKSIMHVPQPKIIIAGSGMSTGGRILFHEKEYISDPNNCFLVVGFQVEGSLGRKILEGLPIVHVLGQEVKNRIEALAIGGYSAHADQKQLLDFVATIKKPLKQVFITHGESLPADALKKLLAEKFDIPGLVPKYEQMVEL